MITPAQFTSELIDWYTQRARPFFIDVLPTDKLTDFDKDYESLKRRLANLDTELVVCFLGSSGVGKSTLLNAIIDGQHALVPAGGVGPLTAQALVVRYAPQPKMEVEYYGVGMIQRTYFGLEQMYKAEIGSPPVGDDDVLLDNLDETDLPDMEDGMPESEVTNLDSSDSERDEKRQQWRRRAQLLVTGNQEEERDPRYLADCLREVVGKPRYWKTSVRKEDELNLQTIQKVLNKVKENPDNLFLIDASLGEEKFKQAIHAHSVGFMAPLIKNLTIIQVN